ncbi:hypothetical protein DRO69_14170 [Candidatus Bathyarchaeota archaeon]|nr:MAG: hypothetical protein DRO69_14170 [Candidatus Bathyarchaeota archaeon]
MSTEKRLKRFIFRWTAPKGFAAIILFSALALFVEYVFVSLFISAGLTEKNPFTTTFQVPLINSSFTITISPLLHLIPFSVIIVLISSWTYLTKYIAVAPRRIKPIKKPPKTQKRKLPKKMRRRLRRVSRALKSLYRRLSGAVLRVRGISYVLQKLFFARAAIKSTANVLMVFLASFIILYILAYPSSTYDAVIGFYKWSPAFLGFVAKTIEIAEGVGQAISPIGQMGSAITNTLLAAAPSFRSTLENFGASTVGGIAKLDLVSKYALCQNLAAFISAITALAYGRYYSMRLYRRTS